MIAVHLERHKVKLLDANEKSHSPSWPKVIAPKTTFTADLSLDAIVRGFDIWFGKVRVLRMLENSDVACRSVINTIRWSQYL